MHWQRTFLHPMLANFDAPAREECAAARGLSNTPQQALTLLNDPTFVEAARVLAERAWKWGDTDVARLGRLFEAALSRPIRPNEAASLTAFLRGQREYYSANPADARKLMSIGQAATAPDEQACELAAWTSVCRVVLNLHESITRY